ncbi:MAG TPA: Gfo/Idh/MocA family oxidoreductase [Bryobacteraceae bacterium]|jgi:predicted dehydrogenase|nr:Gfo/Idh/MocA family oxidoreductase [Bryobacteraceae bacterium]
MSRFWVVLILTALGLPPASIRAQEPFRLAIVGLAHGHADGFISRVRRRSDVRLVGISEPDEAVRLRYQEKFHLDPSLLFSSAEEMLSRTRPEAAALFTSTYDHLSGVELCARLKVPVMMEKPLAVSMDHARRMEAAVNASKIPLVVNYETTWYRSNQEAWSSRQQIGGIRKVVVHDGHRGPKEIGVQPEFLSWLTDPEKNGAGALFDFGCYGADLITWLMNGERPLTVTAVTQQIKPDVYPRVDDEATILLTYPHAQGIIQASWNWPFDRKDMEVYGKTGYVITVAQNSVRRRLQGQDREEQIDAPELAAPFTDSISYLEAVARGNVKASGLSSLRTNMIVTEILDAARQSARSGQTVKLAAR